MSKFWYIVLDNPSFTEGGYIYGKDRDHIVRCPETGSEGGLRLHLHGLHVLVPV